MADIEKTPQNTTIARPSFIPTTSEGTTHITKDDLQIPRLALAQGLTPEVAEGVDGFVTGVLFNSVSKQIYGKGPIYFYIVRADKPRFIEFYPRESGGGVKDMSVPAGDVRTRFTTDANGKSLKPAATKFYDYFILMEPFTEETGMQQLIALSFKSSGLKMARELNLLIKYRQAPLYAGRYALTSITERNSKGVFAAYYVENAGWVTDEKTLAFLARMYNSLTDKTVIVDREPGEDDDDFEPTASEA